MMQKIERLEEAPMVPPLPAMQKKETGKILEIHCTYDPNTRGGWSKDGRKVMGTLHWVSEPHAITAEVRLHEHLFAKSNPDDVKEKSDFKVNLTPHSLKKLTCCQVEPSLAKAKPGNKYQFLRQGYFCVDSDSTEGKLVFNQTGSLRDTWTKIEKTHKNEKKH